MIAMPSELDWMSPRKSSSLRTRSSVTRPSSRMRRTRRPAIRVKTVAKPTSAAAVCGWSCSSISARATGRLRIAPTTSSMPSGLTWGAPARALRSAKVDGARAAAMTTVCRPRATATSEPAVHTQDG